MNPWRRRTDNGRRPATVDLLEPRILYSADALSGFLPVLIDDQDEPEDNLSIATDSERQITEQGLHTTRSQDTLTDEKTSSAVVEFLDEGKASSVKSVVFVDHSVPSADSLLREIDTTDALIIPIAASDNGLLLVTQTLSELADLDAVVIVSHGQSGSLMLGNAVVDQQTLVNNSPAIESWSQALSERADILLLGCEVAEGSLGEQFVQTLSALTSADIAASTDLTGHDSLGGDWALEYQTGEITAFENAHWGGSWRHTLGEITVDLFNDQFTLSDGTTLTELIALQQNGKEVSLREAVYAAQQGDEEADTIYLPAGDYTLSRYPFIGDSNPSVGDLDITDDTRIEAISDEETRIVNEVIGVRILDVDSTSLTLSGVSLTSAASSISAGGAIRGTTGSTITLIDSTISGTSSRSNGGAIFTQGDVDITRSTIRDTSSAGIGGAIAANTALIEDSRIELASARNGGGVYGINVTLINSSVEFSTASEKGGGIFAQGSLTIQASRLSANSADEGGGGAYAQGSAAILQSRMENNASSTGSGGGLLLEGGSTVTASVFSENSAKDNGGAILTQGPLTIETSDFVKNTVNGSGGALYLDAGTSTTVEISKTGFTDNEADSDGGAIQSLSSLKINQSSFFNNNAKTGSGGAISIDLADLLTVNNTTFGENTAGTSGGAILSNIDSSIENSSFVRNTSVSTGAAIAVGQGAHTLAGSLFAGNLESGSATIPFAGSLMSEGFNLFDYDVTNAGTQATDLNNAQAGIGEVTRVGFVDAYSLTKQSDAVNAGRVTESGAEDALGYARDDIADIGASELDEDQGIVFFSDGDGSIVRSNLAFSNLQSIVESRPSPGSVSLNETERKIYWLEDNNTRLVSASLDGESGVSLLMSGLTDARTITVDAVAGHLYIGFAGNQARFEQYALSDLSQLATHALGRAFTPLDAEFSSATRTLHWVDAGENGQSESFRSADVDANSVLTRTGIIAPSGVAVTPSGDALYGSGSDSLWYVDLGSSAGTVSTPIYPGMAAINYEQLTDQIVWASSTTNQIRLLAISDNSQGDIYQHGSAINDLDTMRTSFEANRPVIQLNSGLDIDEGDHQPITDSVLTTKDTDTHDSDVIYVILSQPTNGTLSLDGVEAPNQFSQAQLTTGALVYEHDGSEAATDSMTFEVTDGVSTSRAVSFNFRVNAVNDDPSLAFSSDPVVIQEGQPYVFEAGRFLITDPDNANEDITLHITAAVVSGTIEVDGTPSGLSGTFTYQQLADGKVIYQHDGSEQAPADFVFKASDLSSESDEAALSVSFTQVNDAPEPDRASVAITLVEGEEYTFRPADLSVTDPDNSNADMSYRYQSGLDHGYLSLNGSEMASDDSFTHAQLADGKVVYHHDGSETTADTVVFVVSDGTDDSSPITVTLNILAVNDPPVMNVVQDQSSLLEGGQWTFSRSTLEVIDPDSDEATFSYRYTNILQAGHIELDEQPLASNEVFTQAQIDAGELVYHHNGTETSSERIELAVSDDQSGSGTGTLILTIEPVNDPPSLGTPAEALTLLEGESHVLGTEELAASDSDNASAEFMYSFTGELAGGFVELNEVALAPGEAFSHAQLVGGEVRYRHAGDEPAPVSIAFRVFDGNLYSEPANLVFDIQPVNDRPQLTASEPPPEVSEAGEVTLTTAHVSASDPDTADADLVYRLVSAPNHGSLKMDDTTLAAQDTFTLDQLQNDRVSYRHNGSESTEDVLQLVVSDGDLDSEPVALSIAIEPINDAPVLSVTADDIAVDEGGTWVLSPNQLVASDNDHAVAEIIYRLESEPVYGDLMLNDNVLSAGDQFTHAQLSEAAVRYRHAGAESTVEVLSFSLSDGVASSEQRELTIAITAVNDAPVFSEQNAVISLPEGGSHVLTRSELPISDSDDDLAEISFQLEAPLTAGVLEVNGVALEAGARFSYQQLIDGEVIYSHRGGERFSDQVSIVAFDAQGGTVATILQVSISPVNDVPDLISERMEAPENTPGAVMGEVTIVDPDAGDSHDLEVDDARFSIVDGQLVLKPDQSLDYEQQDSIDIALTVTDAAGASHTSTVTVHVLDQNDKPELRIEPRLEIGDGFQIPESAMTDQDRDNLSVAVTLANGEPLPDWLSFDAEGRKLQVATGTEAQPDTALLIHLRDSRGGEISVPVTFVHAPPQVDAAKPVVDTNETIIPTIESPEPATPSSRPASPATDNDAAAPAAANQSDAGEKKNQNVNAADDEVTSLHVDVDLQALITPLRKFGSLQLAQLENNTGTTNAQSLGLSSITDVDSIDLDSLFRMESTGTLQSSGSLARALDSASEEFQESQSLSKTIIGSSAGISTGLSVGYLIWLIRGGTLVGSVLSSLPAWRFVDPLPVLSSMGDDFAEDDESLESMVDATTPAQ